MKISKRQLRRIIKEEKIKLLESPAGGFDNPNADDIIDGYYNAITQLIFDDMAAAGIDPYENAEEVAMAVRALQNIIMDLEAGNF
tara:strand:+ start:1392 stop:1646 length:255 start_codon:yes stop_codon:yes gene_type:complete